MSAFWVRKMNTYFDRIDFDQDGSITRADFVGMATRFIETGKLCKDRSNDMMETLTAVWDTYLAALGGGNAIKKDEFVVIMKKLITDPKLKSVLEGPLPLFFHCVDSNNDKVIDEKEYESFFNILGLDPKLASEAFRAIDTNHDGDISLSEFIESGTLFFLTQEESCPNSLFWGPINAQ